MTYERFLSEYQVEDVIVNSSSESRVQLLNNFITFTKQVGDMTCDGSLLEMVVGNKTLSIYMSKSNNELIITLPNMDTFTIKFFGDEAVSKFITDLITYSLPVMISSL